MFVSMFLDETKKKLCGIIKQIKDILQGSLFRICVGGQPLDQTVTHIYLINLIFFEFNLINLTNRTFLVSYVNYTYFKL